MFVLLYRIVYTHTTLIKKKEENRGKIVHVSGYVVLHYQFYVFSNPCALCYTTDDITWTGVIGVFNGITERQGLLESDDITGTRAMGV